MKHLDVVDGVLAAVPVEDRPVPAIIGQNLTLLILKLRLLDAELWTACTATPSVIMLENIHIQDYLLLSNGLAHSTPCELFLTAPWPTPGSRFSSTTTATSSTRLSGRNDLGDRAGPEEAISYIDDLMLNQLQVEGIGFTDMSSIHLATAYIHKSYTELIHLRYIPRFHAIRYMFVA